MANGNFAGGDGTESNPYLIEDAFDLDAVRNNLSGYYKLINDIDLNISPFNEGEGWVPIGDNSTNDSNSHFTGVFDGDGYVVKNLYINRPNVRFQGLFGHTQGATISNVGVEDVDVTGENYTGGLVGTNYNSTIINSYSTGSVTGGSYVGGLVGYNLYNSTIINSYSTGSITGGSNTGGLAGQNSNSSIITSSYSTGSVTGGSNTGGLVGSNQSSSVANSYSTGNVTGSGDYVGGLVGYNANSTVKNSYSTGSVSGDNETGGLVGRNYDSSTIKNSYSTGSVNGSGNYIGGLVGRSYYNGSTVTNSFWNIETSGMTSSAGGTGLTTAEMQTAQTFIDTGWDKEVDESGEQIWYLFDGFYPMFELPFVNKILISLNGDYKYYDSTWKSLGDSPTEQDYLDFGMDIDFVETIPESAWQELDNLTISMYTDYSEKEEVIITQETEPFTLYDVLSDSAEILYYTDDESVTDPEIEFTANYSPLDEIEGDFDVVTWTNEEPTEVEDIETATKDSDIEDGELYKTEIDLTQGQGVTKIDEVEK